MSISPEELVDRYALVNMNEIQPNRYQPRKEFSQKSIEELAESIAENGLVQPITIREIDDGEDIIKYELVAGERRYRAHTFLNKKRIKAVIKAGCVDEQAMTLAMIENLQREDLNGIEEAEGVKRMMDTLGLTQEAVADKLGKTRSWVSNTVRLNKLPETLKAKVREGKLDKWHATVLLGAPKEVREELATKTIENGWTTDTLKKKVASLDPAKQELAKKKAEENAISKAQAKTVKDSKFVLLEASSIEVLEDLVKLLKEEGGWEIWTGEHAFKEAVKHLPKEETKEQETLAEPEKQEEVPDVPRRRSPQRRGTTADA